LVHDPTAIKHILIDNAANYRKDSIQRRILARGLSDGLLSVGESAGKSSAARSHRCLRVGPSVALHARCEKPPTALANIGEALCRERGSILPPS
jgi:hypothetical protein